MQRVNYFKSGFGGREVDFVAAHEKILRPTSFRMLRAAHRAFSAMRRREPGP